MLFCKRHTCAADEVTVFDMPLSCLKWRIKNFTAGDIYVSLGTYDSADNMRIAPGGCDIAVDRDPKTGSRRTSRRVCVRAAAAGEVEVVYE